MNFKKGFWEYFGINIAVSLGTVFSLGIATTWMYAWFTRWSIENIDANDNNQLTFKGTGGGLLIKILLPVIIIIITTVFVLLHLVNYGIDPSTYELNPMALLFVIFIIITSSTIYYFYFLWLIEGLTINGGSVEEDDKRISFLSFIGFSILASFISIITLGLGIGIALKMFLRKIYGDTTIGGNQLTFDASSGKVALYALGMLILSFIPIVSFFTGFIFNYLIFIWVIEGTKIIASSKEDTTSEESSTTAETFELNS